MLLVEIFAQQLYRILIEIGKFIPYVTVLIYLPVEADSRPLRLEITDRDFKSTGLEAHEPVAFCDQSGSSGRSSGSRTDG